MATKLSYGTMPDGREVNRFTLRNAQGMTATVCEFGAVLVSLEMPDRNGQIADLTLGYDSLEGWLGNNAYLGATVGRFGNRIRDGKFSLDGKTYQLATNNTPSSIPCHLHGGVKGFDRVLWKGEVRDNSVIFRYLSPDGEEGYPGNLDVTITYTLTEENELLWEAKAVTDAPTIVNLVHHTYWNLSGDPRQSINDHLLQINADHFLPTDAGLIPTGERAAVSGTPMDFASPRLIGERVNADFEALHLAGGYDHCWVLRAGDGMRLAASLFHPPSGRKMEVFTDQPAVQFYGGNFLDGTILGKHGHSYAHRTGLCLETENFPDAPNQPSFPSALLRPGEVYQHKMIHRFTTEPTA